jgi:plastocyanin
MVMRTQVRRCRLAGGVAVAAFGAAVVGAGVAQAAAPPAKATISVTNTALTPAATSVSAGGTVTWSIKQGSHTITQKAPLKLFTSGAKAAGSNYAFKFFAAGTYPYSVTGPKVLSGTVGVPVKLTPTTGTRNTFFNVRWSAADLPAGFGERIDVKEPGSSTWTNFVYLTPVHDATLIPSQWGNKTGTYSFRAKLVRGSNLNVSSGYSPIATITVK